MLLQAGARLSGSDDGFAALAVKNAVRGGLAPSLRIWAKAGAKIETNEQLAQ